MPWAVGHPLRTKKCLIRELEPLEERSLLSSGKLFSQIAPITQTDGAAATGGVPALLLLVPEHDSSSRGADAWDGVASRTYSRSTVAARAPILADQGVKGALGDHHRLSGVVSKGNASSARDSDSLVRLVPANSAGVSDVSSVLKDSEAHDSEENRATTVIATRLPEDSRYAIISDEEAVWAKGQSRVDGAGYAPEAAGSLRVGLGIGSDPTPALAIGPVGDRMMATFGLPPAEQIAGRFRDADPAADRIAGAPELPDAREADLFASFSPLDRAGLERAIDQLLNRLAGLDEELRRLGSWTDLIFGLVGAGISLAAAAVIRRQLGTEWDHENVLPPGEMATWLPGQPGLPPS